MASNATPPITEKEVREVYENLSKERLVDILVNHWKLKKGCNNNIPWKKGIPTNLIGF